MIIDDRTELASALPVPTGVGRQQFSDVIDLQGTTLMPNTGEGAANGMFLNVTVAATFTSGGAATVVFEIVTADNMSMSSPVVLAGSGPIPVAALVAGAVALSIGVPRAPTTKRYLAVTANVAVAALTGGQVSAWLSDGGIATPLRRYADNVA